MSLVNITALVMKHKLFKYISGTRHRASSFLWGRAQGLGVCLKQKHTCMHPARVGNANGHWVWVGMCAVVACCGIVLSHQIIQ
eukprot:1187921-Prorocentrum_minimum.AAC.7